MSSSMSKARKQMAREQAKRDKKHVPKENKQQSTNDLLGMKSLADYNKKTVGEKFGYSLRASWYFEKWFEKLILVVLCILGMWRILMFF